MRVRFARVFFFLAASPLLVSGPAAAVTLLADQVSTPTIAGGYSDPVVQTFMPGQDNIAGVDVLIGGTGALTETVSVSLYSDPGLTNLLATDTIANHPRQTVAEFRWDTVSVTPETTYYFEFITGLLVISAGISNSTDYYDRGNIISGGGNLSFSYEDAQFTTYYDAEFSPVPLPGAAWLMGTALGLLGWMGRRRG